MSERETDLDPEGCGSLVHGVEGVLDLDELARRAESRERKGVLAAEERKSGGGSARARPGEKDTRMRVRMRVI